MPPSRIESKVFMQYLTLRRSFLSLYFFTFIGVLTSEVSNLWNNLIIKLHSIEKIAALFLFSMHLSLLTSMYMLRQLIELALVHCLDLCND